MQRCSVLGGEEPQAVTIRSLGAVSNARTDVLQRPSTIRGRTEQDSANQSFENIAHSGDSTLNLTC